MGVVVLVLVGLSELRDAHDGVVDLQLRSYSQDVDLGAHGPRIAVLHPVREREWPPCGGGLESREDLAGVTAWRFPFAVREHVLLSAQWWSKKARGRLG